MKGWVIASAQWINLASALLGVIGTIIMYRSSYSVESLETPGAFAEQVMPEIQRIKTANAKRMRWQRVGLGFLCAAFVLRASGVHTLYKYL